tara:strand:+ start:1559 stop:1672 length:114 start_codon:yes stop_codon:yes gene_type:complete
MGIETCSDKLSYWLINEDKEILPVDLFVNINWLSGVI